MLTRAAPAPLGVGDPLGSGGHASSASVTTGNTMNTTSLTLIAVLFTTLASAQPVPDLSQADAAINAAIEKKNCPGAVLLVGRTSGVLYEKAYGSRAVQPA